MLMVEQNVRLAVGIADRYVVLRDGRVILEVRSGRSRAPTRSWCGGSTSDRAGGFGIRAASRP